MDSLACIKLCHGRLTDDAGCGGYKDIKLRPGLISQDGLTLTGASEGAAAFVGAGYGNQLARTASRKLRYCSRTVCAMDPSIRSLAMSIIRQSKLKYRGIEHQSCPESPSVVHIDNASALRHCIPSTHSGLESTHFFGSDWLTQPSKEEPQRLFAFQISA
jgi:hypothetical protein